MPDVITSLGSCWQIYFTDPRQPITHAPCVVSASLNLSFVSGDFSQTDAGCNIGHSVILAKQFVVVSTEKALIPQKFHFSEVVGTSAGNSTTFTSCQILGRIERKRADINRPY
jgi:hypothetical protein